jgi:hypothetical protein
MTEDLATSRQLKYMDIILEKYNVTQIQLKPLRRRLTWIILKDPGRTAQ